jgi:type II secretory pathway component PulF
MGVSYYMVAVVFPQILGFIQKQGKRVPLPTPTRILIQVSDFIEIYGLYLLASPFLLGLGYWLARNFIQGAGVWLDRGFLRVPLIGKAFRDHANTMWCRTLGALLRSGLDIISALDLVQENHGQSVLRRSV